jgi:hypothetical protein
VNALDISLIYLLAAVAGVVLCRLVKLPPMLGYLGIGVLIGPHALALAQDSAGVRYLAEFGVVFLMFVIGLEFSLPKLRAMKRHVFGLGTAQVVLTVLLTTLASLAMGWLLPQWWRMDWQAALALGGVMAMSSTAIVVKLVADRLELDSDHGKRVVGILLFQDLAVVPFAGADPGPGCRPRTVVAGAGHGLAQGGGAADAAAHRRPAHHALVADPGGAAQERRAVHAQPAAHHAGAGLADRARRPVAGPGRVCGRHADCRDRIQAPGGNRHPPLSTTCCWACSSSPSA